MREAWLAEHEQLVLAADALDKQVRSYKSMIGDICELVYRTEAEVPLIVASSMLERIMAKLFRTERRLYQIKLQKAYLAGQIDSRSGK